VYVPFIDDGSGKLATLIINPDTVNEATRNANIYGYNILIGVGAGCYIVTGFTVVQSLVPARDTSNAVAAMTIGKHDLTIWGINSTSANL